jgi:hypothetical protein
MPFFLFFDLHFLPPQNDEKELILNIICYKVPCTLHNYIIADEWNLHRAAVSSILATIVLLY